MTWAEFITAVNERIGPEAERAGNELALAAWIKSALLDLQDKVPSLTRGHETIYRYTDVVEDGHCSVGIFPTGMLKLADCWMIEVSEDAADEVGKKWPVVIDDWNRRTELVHGADGFVNNAALLPDRQKVSFYLWPSMTADKGYVLSMNWDGKKVDYADEEETPFDLDVADAVADWVMAHVRRNIENDLNGYQAFMGTYAAKRRALYTNCVSRA